GRSTVGQGSACPTSKSTIKPHSFCSFPSTMGIGPIIMHATSIDPAAVPRRTLRTGARMPAIGLGTFGSDHVTADEIAAAVKGAAAVGYRHFDCASVYRNEDRLGVALREIIAGGIPREELWIASKLWNDKHSEADVVPS